MLIDIYFCVNIILCIFTSYTVDKYSITEPYYSPVLAATSLCVSIPLFIVYSVTDINTMLICYIINLIIWCCVYFEVADIKYLKNKYYKHYSSVMVLFSFGMFIFD